MFTVSAHCMMHQLYMTMSISTWILLPCMDLRTVNKITITITTYINYTEAVVTCSVAQQHSIFPVEILYKL